MTIAGSPTGIDVSNHQGLIDWDLVPTAGVQFAFAKASEGDYFNDGWFSRNWSEMRRVGLNRGAYHFARPSSAGAETEASFFLASVNHAGGLEPGDMLVLDMEDEKYHGDAASWSIDFCEYLAGHTGFDPIIYTGPWYLDSRGMDDLELGQFPLWLAAYQQQMPVPPDPWSAVSFWQYTSSGHIPGVRGDCDVNVFNGAADRIPLLGMPGDLPTEPTGPEYVIGPGIRDAMDDHHDLPSTNEHYITPDWSEAYGKSGRKYTYIASLNEVMVFEPS
jgi:lysozyme